MPAAPLPRLGCDAHAHVFGPFASFPLAARASYAPPQATASDYCGMLEALGLARGVLVQPTAHGTDNRAMLHALSNAPDCLRGVAVAGRDTSVDCLLAWHALGVRGLRFSHIPDRSGQSRYRNVVGLEDLVALAPAMRRADMHAQVWTHAHLWPSIEQTLLDLDLPLVIDHMGRFDPAEGTREPGFRRICERVRGGAVWVKMTAYRNVGRLQDLPQARPFHDALVEAGCDRLLWGSDWPHINMGATVVDPGFLLTQFVDWLGDADALREILVDNPARLYGF